MAYEIIINKKFNHVKLYSVVKSVKVEQNQISKSLSSLVSKYLFKKKEQNKGQA